MKAILRYLRIAPKKVNLVAGLVRGKGVTEAMELLKFIPKRTAKPLRETILSAVGNAENNFRQKREDLVVKSVVVTGGPTLKRSNPVSRGRSHPILKRTSHIYVEVGIVEKKVETMKRKDRRKNAVKKEANEAPKKEKTEILKKS